MAVASVEESGDTVPATIVEPDLENKWHNLPRPKLDLTLLILTKRYKTNREKIKGNSLKMELNVTEYPTLRVPVHFVPDKLNPSIQEVQIEPSEPQDLHGSIQARQFPVYLPDWTLK